MLMPSKLAVLVRVGVGVGVDGGCRGGVGVIGLLKNVLGYHKFFF